MQKAQRMGHPTLLLFWCNQTSRPQGWATRLRRHLGTETWGQTGRSPFSYNEIANVHPSLSFPTATRARSSPGIDIQLADRYRLSLEREVGGSVGQDETNRASFRSDRWWESEGGGKTGCAFHPEHYNMTGGICVMKPCKVGPGDRLDAGDAVSIRRILRRRFIVRHRRPLAQDHAPEQRPWRSAVSRSRPFQTSRRRFRSAFQPKLLPIDFHLRVRRRCDSVWRPHAVRRLPLALPKSGSQEWVRRL